MRLAAVGGGGDAAGRQAGWPANGWDGIPPPSCGSPACLF